MKFLVLLLLIGLIGFSLYNIFNPFTVQSAPASNVNVAIDLNTPEASSSMSLGATHAQYSLDSWGNAAAITSGKNLIKDSTNYQNQHILGWGALSIWADSNASDSANWAWGSLDDRINIMRETNAEKVITLCCAPTWMFDPSKNGETDWAQNGTPPTPENYPKFASMSAEIAKRYPDVKYFQVWNEMKGFYNASLNRWDYEKYTDIYNQVYDAVKAVRPDAKIGGPYVVMDSWGNPSAGGWPGPTYSWGTLDKRALDTITYWLNNKHGADFITIDGNNSNRDNIKLVDEYASIQKYSDIVNWLRQQPNGGANLPIWWAEWYSYGPANANLKQQTTYMSSSFIKFAKNGTSVPLMWAPQGDNTGASYPVGIFTDTRNSGGGIQTVLYPVMRDFKNFFPAGTVFYKTTSSSSDIDVLASQTKVMLVSKKNAAVNVNINGTIIPLPAYEVKFANIPAPSPTPTPTPLDTTNPQVSITAPANNAQVKKKAKTDIKANATDNIAVTKVEFLVNNVLTCTDTIAPYVCAWDVPNVAGVIYSLKAKAYDARNNSAVSSINVTSK